MTGLCGFGMVGQGYGRRTGGGTTGTGRCIGGAGFLTGGAGVTGGYFFSTTNIHFLLGVLTIYLMNDLIHMYLFHKPNFCEGLRIVLLVGLK